MTTAAKPPVFVVLQLSGGNDYMNSVVPYDDPHYYDSRKGTLRVGAEDVLKIDDAVGLHPKMAPLKELYDQGDMAIIHGVGYPNSPRSHFRSMDIWHTCEPDTVGTEGWVARAIRDLDPAGENPVTGVNIGLSLPRAMVLPGVSVASVADLSTYGLLTKHRAGAAAHEDAAALLDDVRPRHRDGPGQRVPGPDGPRRAERRGHPEGDAGQLRVGGRVRDRPDREGAARRRDDPPRPTWGRGSSTRSSPASTRTPRRRRRSSGCGPRSRGRCRTSGTICGRTTRTRT